MRNWTPGRFAVGSLLTVFMFTSLAAEDWTGFRGSRGDGVSQEAHVPLEWNRERNVRWRAPLPGPGDSSPVVIGDRVYVTCATEGGKKRSLFCFDRASGKELWTQTVEYLLPDPTHKTNPYCGSSPAADADRVVVWHGSAGAHCYDHAGTLLWSRDLGEFRHIWGYGSSPVIYGDLVLMNCGPGARMFLIALSKATGETVWQVDEPGGNSGEEKDAVNGKAVWKGSWSTPVIAQIDGKDQVLVSYPQRVKGYDPATGRVLWWIDGLGELVYTSPVIGDGFGVAMGGFHGPAIGFKTGGEGDMTETNRLWRHSQRNPQRIGSGVIVGKHLFVANANPAGAQCLDLESGKELWQTRLPTGEIWGSVVLAQGRLYVTNPEGKTYVFAPNPEKFELLATNELGESTNSTPAISDGQVFLRTFQAVYCIDDR